MRMPTKQPRYFAFMLRVWQGREDDQLVWRASLESPPGGARRGFVSLDALFAFLREQTFNEEREQEQDHRVVE